MQKFKTKYIIFSSGNGTNAINLIKNAQKRDDAEVCAIICDNPDALIISKAKELEVICHVIPYKGSKKNQENKILEIMEPYCVDWILLAGYMRILSPNFLSKFYSKELNVYRVINIHPSLLPDFKGKNAYMDAYKSKQLYSGITVHFVDEGIDTGKIIFQEKFYRHSNDDFECFKQRGMGLEYLLYPRVFDVLKNIELNL